MLESLVRDVILRDGSALRLRSPTPDDEADLRAFFDGLDTESRYLRFHGSGRPDAVARAYALADGDARVALLAHHGGDIVGVAGYDRLLDPVAAEPAFAVAAPFQGRGLGMRMLEQLAQYAAGQGLTRFEAEVLADNVQMLRVFSEAGFSVAARHGGGEVRVLLDIQPTPRLTERIARRDHLASVASLRPLLAPASVAVVGASDDVTSAGGLVLRNILDGGFAGSVWPVNRAERRVCSLPAAPSLEALPVTPELAVIAVPSDEVADVVEEAGRLGVRGVVVVSAGFGDGDADGRRRQEELLEIVRRHGLRLVGPSSLGVANGAREVRLHATLGAPRPSFGPLAISSHSGALGAVLLGQARLRGLGLASFVAVGDRADVAPHDLLEYWEDDDAVGVVLLYVESFGNPRRFAQVARRVSRRKPILAVKGNLAPDPPARTGGRQSHTAAALRRVDAFDALFRHSGVIRLDRADELFDLVELLERQPLPQWSDVGVVTSSAGLGTLVADAARLLGLTLPSLSASTTERLRSALPRGAQLGNPVDVTDLAAPEDFAGALTEVLRDPVIDAAIVLCVQRQPERVLAAVERAAAGAAKPVVASVLDLEGQRPPHGGGRIPNLRFPHMCTVALAHAVQRRAWLSRPLGQAAQPPDVQSELASEIVTEALAHGGDGWMEPAAAQRLLISYGLPVAPTERCRGLPGAVSAATRLGEPVVLKASLPAPSHAGDIDAVLLGLTGPDAIQAGWHELRRRVLASNHSWTGEVVVQPLLEAGADVLVGSVTDPLLGPVLGLGLGGPRPALTHEITFQLPPVSDTEVEELISASSSVTAWLTGFHGSRALDRLALRDLILRFARLVTDVPQIAEADLNAVRVLSSGCHVLDARVRLAAHPYEPPTRTW